MVSGSCLCGEIQYEIEGDVAGTAACHCLPCRITSSNSHSLNYMVPKDKFKFTKGTPKTFTRKGDSGQDVTYNFCNTCPTILTVNAQAMPDIFVVKAGTVGDKAFFAEHAPVAEIYNKNRAPWCTPFASAAQKDAA